jgi:hypothetical protein
MKIYSYHENVGFKKQLELIELWKDSWGKQGFDPIVLNREDAKKSPLYQQYYELVQRVHENISGKTLPDNYWLAAQLEIVAFTTIDKSEIAYMSDYDVINKNFRNKDISGKLHWRDDCCSCFASGNGEAWIRYVNFLLSEEKTITDWCLREKQKTKRTEYGDQDFLIAVHERGLEKNIYSMSRRPALCKMYFPTTQEKNIKLYHLSHNNVDQIIKLYKKYHKIFNVEDSHIDYSNLEEIRLNIARQLLYD